MSLEQTEALNCVVAVGASHRLELDQIALLFEYSPVLKERRGSLIWNFSGRLYWAGYVGVKVSNERHGSLFKHQRVSENCLYLPV